MAGALEKIKMIEKKYMRDDIPEFNVGDTLKMRIKVQEGDKIRLHPYSGIVISKSGKGARAAFTLRKISFGEGVERVFPLHSPSISHLEVVARGVVKRAKLYYLRSRVGKKTRVKVRQETAAETKTA